MIARKLAVLAAALAVLSSCSEDIPTGVDLQGNIGRLRFVNAIPDPTKVPVNILVAGLPFAVNVAYGGFAPGAANPYFPVLQGMQTIAVRRTADTSVRVLDMTLDVSRSHDEWIRHRGDPIRFNPDGGAIALGHPLAASGARLLAHLAWKISRGESKTAIAALCIGGGMGIAAALTAVND